MQSEKQSWYARQRERCHWGSVHSASFWLSLQASSGATTLTVLWRTAAASLSLSWCSMDNPWLSQQATTGQGVPRGIALCQSQQECPRAVWKRDRGLPIDNCETGSGCRRISTSSNKKRSEDRPSVGGQGREAIANSGAYQETTVPKDCSLCYISTAPSPDTGFCLS